MYKSKTLSFFLAVMILLSFMFSCGDADEPASEEESKITTETSEPENQTVYTNITIGETILEIDGINTDYIGKNAVIYNREYTENGNISLYAPEGHEDRTVITVKESEYKGTVSYSVIEINSESGVKTGLYIPVNGFVLSVSNECIPEDLKISTRTDISVSAYENAPSYERTDLCTVSPETKGLVRRVNMLYPESGVLIENKIYLIPSNTTYNVSESYYCISLKLSNGSYYSITETKYGGVIMGPALVFTGDYNIMFAEEHLSKGKLSMIKDEKLNSVSDIPTVTVAGKTYTFDSEHFNTSDGKDGVYLYTADYANLSSDRRGSFIDAVIVDESVAYIGKEDTPTLIPTTNGYLISFAGNSKSDGLALKLGDECSSLLVDISENPDKFVKIGTTVYEITSVNESVTDSDTAVLLTSSYGKTTLSSNTCDIAVSDGKILTVNTEGNTEIPENGYVVSIPSAKTKYYNSAKKLSAGTEVKLSLAGNDYGYYTFAYTSCNTTRYQDNIIIYDSGVSTGTNIYGYEFAVNSDGTITEASSAGNMSIPDGGFVVSGHGTGEETVKSAYKIGAKCKIDKETKTVSVELTPELGIYALNAEFDTLITQYNKAVNEYYSLDYATVNSELDKIKLEYKTAVSLAEEGKLTDALLHAENITSGIKSLSFKMYESLPVENRSVWYRCNEKSDADVLATVKLMSKMGVNAIYLETWYDGQTIGFSSNSLIKHNTSANGNYDALEGFCRIGHQYGIEIHIWVENFFIGITSTELAKNTKEYHLIDKYGNDGCPTMYGYFCFLDPYTEYSRNLIMNLYREYVTNYDIDGIHLDYIRFPEANSESGSDFGYNDDIIAGFQAEYQTTKNPKTMSKSDPLWSKWCLFRENIINSWVKEVYEMVKELNPDIIMSCAVSNDYPNCRTTIFQNFRNWVENGYMDEVFSMSYCSDLETPAKNIKTFTAYTKTESYYSIGLSAFESSPDEILVGQVQVSRDSGAFGQNLFSWGSLIKHSENYFDALSAGVWSEPSVRTDRLSETVSAYLVKFISDIDNVYAYLTPIDGDFYNNLKDKAQLILGKAESFDLKNSDNSQKTDYIDSALKDIDELISIMNGCENSKVSSAMKKDAEFIKKCLAVSLSRIDKQ